MEMRINVCKGFDVNLIQSGYVGEMNEECWLNGSGEHGVWSGKKRAGVFFHSSPLINVIAE